MFQPAYYGLRCQHFWPSCSSQHIMDSAVHICGLPAPNRTLWTVLLASVDFLFQLAHYGLSCQHLWSSCFNQHIMDCAVSICGLPVPTSTLWTVLSASVDFLFQPGLSYMIQAATFCFQLHNTLKKTNEAFWYLDSSRRTDVIYIHNRHCQLDRELQRNCLRHKRLFDASWSSCLR
jgi:hypothetical protein